jgi:hypothetical protein
MIRHSQATFSRKRLPSTLAGAVVDRLGDGEELRESAGDSYGAPEAEYERLFGEDWAEPVLRPAGT